LFTSYEGTPRPVKCLQETFTSGWGSPSALVTLLGGLCLLVLLVVVELRTVKRGGQPLVDLRFFANPPFLSSNLANAMISWRFFGSRILLPISLQN
jgi:DHA2 family multidrug resistance protein